MNYIYLTNESPAEVAKRGIDFTKFNPKIASEDKIWVIDESSAIKIQEELTRKLNLIVETKKNAKSA